MVKTDISIAFTILNVCYFAKNLKPDYISAIN